MYGKRSGRSSITVRGYDRNTFQETRGYRLKKGSRTEAGHQQNEETNLKRDRLIKPISSRYQQTRLFLAENNKHQSDASKSRKTKQATYKTTRENNKRHHRTKMRLISSMYHPRHL